MTYSYWAAGKKLAEMGLLRPEGNHTATIRTRLNKLGINRTTLNDEDIELLAESFREKPQRRLRRTAPAEINSTRDFEASIQKLIRLCEAMGIDELVISGGEARFTRTVEQTIKGEDK